MPVTLEQLQSVKPGDAIYRTTRPLIMHSVERPEDAGSGVLQPVVRLLNGRYIETYTISNPTAARLRRIVPKEKRRRKHSRARYEFVNSDGGRRALESFAHETNDCTVRALALATGCSYADAHAHMKAHGRKDRRGAHVDKAYPAAYLNGLQGYRVTLGAGRTIGEWLRSGELPARAILEVHRHVIAVVDGKVCDSFKCGTRRRVTALYAFRPASEVPVNRAQTPVDAPAAVPVPNTPAAANGGPDRIGAFEDAGELMAAERMAAALDALLTILARYSHEMTDDTFTAYTAADAELAGYRAAAAHRA